jgi:hypothetical protein
MRSMLDLIPPGVSSADRVGAIARIIGLAR